MVDSKEPEFLYCIQKSYFKMHVIYLKEDIKEGEMEIDIFHCSLTFQIAITADPEPG